MSFSVDEEDDTDLPAKKAKTDTIEVIKCFLKFMLICYSFFLLANSYCATIECSLT